MQAQACLPSRPYGDPRQLYVQPGVAAQDQGRPGAGFATGVDVAINILNRRPVTWPGMR